MTRSFTLRTNVDNVGGGKSAPSLLRSNLFEVTCTINGERDTMTLDGTHVSIKVQLEAMGISIEDAMVTRLDA